MQEWVLSPSSLLKQYILPFLLEVDLYSQPGNPKTDALF
jgi:hypothetical protein